MRIFLEAANGGRDYYFQLQPIYFIRIFNRLKCIRFMKKVIDDKIKDLRKCDDEFPYGETPEIKIRTGFYSPKERIAKVSTKYELSCRMPETCIQ